MYLSRQKTCIVSFVQLIDYTQILYIYIYIYTLKLDLKIHIFIGGTLLYGMCCSLIWGGIICVCGGLGVAGGNGG